MDSKLLEKIDLRHLERKREKKNATYINNGVVKKEGSGNLLPVNRSGREGGGSRVS